MALSIQALRLAYHLLQPLGAIAAGRPAELRGFWRFSLREYEAREARNPRTGKNVSVGASKRVRFKASPKVRKEVAKEG